MNIYPPSSYCVITNQPLGYSNDTDQACNDIYAACKGFGTDEEKLTSVLASKTAAERSLIARRYEELFKKNLRKLIDSETSGDYGRVLELLCLPMEEAEALIVRRATKGMGTDEKMLYPILCGRTNEEMQILKKSFFKLYEKDLAVVLDSELSGDLKKFLTACLQASTEAFNPSVHTPEKAEVDADTLYNAGQGKWGTDEKTFYQVILTSPAEHLRCVDNIYAKKYGYTLEKAIKKEFSGKVEDALVFHVGTIIKPELTLAELFEKSMKGFGTDEDSLSADMVRYAHVLPQVKAAYQKKYGKSLRDRVHGETSGKYRALLLTLLENN